MSFLPALPQLRLLRISESSGFGAWNDFPTLSRGLVYLELPYNSDLDDAAADRILTWLSSPSTLTLSSILMPITSLTRVPNQIDQFSNMTWVDLYGNNIPVVATGSFKFTRPAESVNAMSCDIISIEPGSFQGI